jgi:hypothetical protein
MFLCINLPIAPSTLIKPITAPIANLIAGTINAENTGANTEPTALAKSLISFIKPFMKFTKPSIALPSANLACKEVKTGVKF